MSFVCERCGSSYEAEACQLCSSTIVPHAARDPFLGRTIGGRYRVLRKLGQGGMGAVYLAEQVGLGHKVALKFLNAQLLGRPELGQRFLNEARTYARIAHPHAVAFHDFGQDAEGNLYISMEYIEGPDLKTLLDQRGPLPLGEAVEIALQVADALEHAHARGVIHRDLKPENVIVRHGLRGPHAKVLDFGIARLLGDEVTRLTIEGSIAGTPQYMPPEQVHGQDVDARADVYVLAVVLFELVTGRQPFAGPSIPDMLYKQAREPMPLLADVRPELALPGFDAFLQKATAKDRERRHPSMAAFAAELLQVASTPEFRAAAAKGAGAPGEGAASPLGGTWIRGPGAPRGTTPAPPAQAAGQTLLGTGGDQAEGPGGTVLVEPARPAPPGELELAREAPPRRRRSRGGSIAAGAAFVLLAVGGAGWLYAAQGPASAREEPAAAVPPPAVDAAPAPKAEAGVEPADAPAPPPEDPNRTRLLATEILIKANAEFVSGNLDSAKAILATVPDHGEVRERVERLGRDIRTVSERLAEGRALARRGDCKAAIRVFDEIVRKWPGIREAAAGKAACQRMLPPALAE